MKLIRDWHHFPGLTTPCVVTIGNFDGVHLGHQAVLKQVKQKSQQLNLPSCVIIFEPHPKEFFFPATAPSRLTNWREKYTLLKAAGIDQLLLVNFNETFANLSASDFINKILLQGLQVKYLLVGEDFRFGKQRQGDINLLKQVAAENNFHLDICKTIDIAKDRVSSSAVRNALVNGDLDYAAQLLGRHYSMQGRVVHGDKLGRQLGFPTANILPKRLHVPIRGIYAVKIYGVAKEPLMGVCSIGNRPTVDGTHWVLEVYIFNFQQDIYGRALTIEFLHYIRPEEKFASLAALTEHIAQDVSTAKVFFGI